jgi:hypothetical protein
MNPVLTDGCNNSDGSGRSSRAVSRRPPLGVLAALALSLLPAAGQSAASSILFIGNSFTYAGGSAVQFYRPDTVTDLNNQGVGGVPALFKSFINQAGLAYDVYLETQPAVGIDWHLDHKLGVIGQRPWDMVIMLGYSTLDQKRPGDPKLLIASVRQMSEFLRAKNPAVDLRLIATWPRADQIYQSGGAWYGKSIEAMDHDLRGAYDLAAAGVPGIRVIAVGDAWVRAMHSGVADNNPYDGIDAGKIDLWTSDNYHGSSYGYYLEALMLFGSVTGRDPRTLGSNECSGLELGVTAKQMVALQQIAFEQLAAENSVISSPPNSKRSEGSTACTHAH